MQRLRQLLDRISDGWVLTILALVGAAAIGVSVGAHIASGQDWYGWWDSLAQNFGAGLFGTIVAFLLIDRIIGGREKRTEKELELIERKKAIIQQMGSPVKDAALEAVRIARIEGWLHDGSLEGANLVGANLGGAKLMDANLQGADLESTNLGGAKLIDANLQGADLRGANLERADLRGANLQGALLFNANMQGAVLERTHLEGADLSFARLLRADLWSANLHAADLRSANLQGATLIYTRLEGANLGHANLRETGLVYVSFSGDTVLPDESRWKPDTELTRFTDPQHPNFWRSDDSASPAYQGEESQPQEAAGPEKKARKRRKKGE